MAQSMLRAWSSPIFLVKEEGPLLFEIYRSVFGEFPLKLLDTDMNMSGRPHVIHCSSRSDAFHAHFDLAESFG